MREGEVRHPITHKFLGHYYKRLGSVKVLAAQDTTAIAAISVCFGVPVAWHSMRSTSSGYRRRPARPVRNGHPPLPRLAQETGLTLA